MEEEERPKDDIETNHAIEPSLESEAKENSCDVKVQIRLKQCEEKESTRYHVYSHGTQLHVPNMKGRLELDRWYGFDYIYSTIATNKEVYHRASHDLVENALQGINTALFAYGQTGSGKTHTLMSKDGVTARMISQLFHRIWKDRAQDYKISCSCFQIYNEQIFDLLNPRNAECFVREDMNGEVYIENIVNVSCETPMDVYELINIGRKSLVIGETKLGRITCSSHAVCQLSIEKRMRIKGERKRSMQETYLADGTSVDENESGYVSSDLDFYTVPFDKVELKRRHKHAANRINEQKCMFRSPSSLSQSPSRTEYRSASTDQSPRLAFKFDSLRAGSTNSRVNSRPSSRSSSRNEYIRSCSTPPTTQTETEFSDTSFNKSPKSPARAIKSRIPTLKRTRYQSTASNTSGNSDFSIPTKWSTIDSDSESIRFDSENSFSFSEGCSDDYFDIDDSPFTDENDENIDPDIPVHKSRINIIDLAGSERIQDTNIGDEHLKEVQNINLSLLELGNVISALASGKKKKHIPYRNSVLTRILQDSLGGNCKTTFLLCVSTKEKDAYETKCTLEFGQKLRRICTKPVMNVDVDYKRKYEQLMKTIKDNETKNGTASLLANSSIDIVVQKEAAGTLDSCARKDIIQLENGFNENGKETTVDTAFVGFSVKQQENDDVAFLQQQIEENEKKLKKKNEEHLDLQIKYFRLQKDSRKLKQGMNVDDNSEEINAFSPDLPILESISSNEEGWKLEGIKAIKQELLELQARYNSLVEETKNNNQDLKNDLLINSCPPNNDYIGENSINISTVEAELDFDPSHNNIIDEEIINTVNISDQQTEIDFSDIFGQNGNIISANVLDITKDNEKENYSLIEEKDKEIDTLKKKLMKLKRQEKIVTIDASTSTLNVDNETKHVTKQKNLLEEPSKDKVAINLDKSEDVFSEYDTSSLEFTCQTSDKDSKSMEDICKSNDSLGLNTVTATPYPSLPDDLPLNEEKNGNNRNSACFKEGKCISKSFNDSEEYENKLRSPLSVMVDAETNASCSDLGPDLTKSDEENDKLSNLKTKYHSLLGSLENVIKKKKSERIDSETNTSCTDLSQIGEDNENVKKEMRKLKAKYQSLLGSLEKVIERKKSDRIDSETNTSMPDLTEIDNAEKRCREKEDKEEKNTLLLNQKNEEIDKLKKKYHALLEKVEHVVVRKKSGRRMCDSEIQTHDPDLITNDVIDTAIPSINKQIDGKDSDWKKLDEKDFEKQVVNLSPQTENEVKATSPSNDLLAGPKQLNEFKLVLEKPNFDETKFDKLTQNDTEDINLKDTLKKEVLTTDEFLPSVEKGNHITSSLSVLDEQNQPSLEITEESEQNETKFDKLTQNDIKNSNFKDTLKEEMLTSDEKESHITTPLSVLDEEKKTSLEITEKRERKLSELSFRYELSASSEENLSIMEHKELERSSSSFSIKVIHIPDEPLYRDFSTSTDDLKTSLVDTDNLQMNFRKLKTRDVGTSTEEDLTSNVENSCGATQGAPIVVTFLQPGKTSDLTQDTGNTTSIIKRSDNNPMNHDFNVKSALQFWLFNLKQSLANCQQTLLSDDTVFEQNDNVSPSDNIPTFNLSAILVDMFEVIFRTFCDVRSPLEEGETPSTDTSLQRKQNQATLMRSHAKKLAIIHESLMDRKKTIEKDLFCFIQESFCLNDELQSIPENPNLIAVITNNIFDDDFMLTDFDYKLNDVLNLVLAEHTLTACTVALSKSLKSLNYISLRAQVDDQFPSPRQTRPHARNSSPTPGASYELFPDPRCSYISIDLGDKNPRNSYISYKGDKGDKEKLDSDIPSDDGDDKKPFLNRVFCMPIKSRKAKELKKKKDEQKAPVKR